MYKRQPQAIARAKGYITAALSAGLDLGAGSGPLDHTLGGKDIFTWMNGAPAVSYTHLLREKHLDDADMLAEAKTISALCRAYHVPFILNDNVPLLNAGGSAFQGGFHLLGRCV